MKKLDVKKMTVLAMLTALSVILYFIAEIPIIPGFSHLKIDLSDVPALIGAIVINPLGGIVIELLKNLFHLIRTSTFGIGETANFIVGAVLVATVSAIYRKHKAKSKVKAITIASLIGMVSVILSGIIANAILYPIFMYLLGVKIESAAVFITYLWSTVAMNFIKALVTVIPVLPLLKVLDKQKLINPEGI